MVCTDENAQKLSQLLEGYGIATSEEQRHLLLKHLDLVVEKNRVMNLTRIVDPDEAIIRHVVDSLLLMPSFSGSLDDVHMKFVDVGTGAGFPGIPLGIMTNWNGVLIDSVGKKVGAVGEFIEKLELSKRLSVQAIRAEDLARKQRESFDVMTARAVADLGILVEYASPLLKKGGHLVVSKARISDDEIQRGHKTGGLVGMKSVSRETYELPNEQGHREVLVFERSGTSKIKLPRQTGMAKNKPLVS